MISGTKNVIKSSKIIQPPQTKPYKSFQRRISLTYPFFIMYLSSRVHQWHFTFLLPLLIIYFFRNTTVVTSTLCQMKMLSNNINNNSINVTLPHCADGVFSPSQTSYRLYANMPISICGILANLINIIVFADSEMRTLLMNHFLLALSISGMFSLLNLSLRLIIMKWIKILYFASFISYLSVQGRRWIIIFTLRINHNIWITSFNNSLMEHRLKIYYR